MKGLLAFLLVMLLCSGAYAASTNVTLVWDEPTTNVDGTPLSDLKGYKVYWGKTPRTTGAVPPAGYTSNADAARPSSCGTFPSTGKCYFVVPTLPDGTYFFAVTAYDLSGNESGYSNEVSKTVDATAPAVPGALKVTVTITVTP